MEMLNNRLFDKKESFYPWSGLRWILRSHVPRVYIPFFNATVLILVNDFHP